MPSTEFMKAIEKYDCPDKIFKLAKTEYEKAVAVEFFLIHRRLDESDNDTKWLKYLVKAVFSVGVIGLIMQVLSSLLGL